MNQLKSSELFLGCISDIGTPISFATALICSTKKGQGVKFMTDRPTAWHIGGFSDETLKECTELIKEYTAERLAEV